MSFLSNLFGGTPEVREQVSNLTPSQMRGQKELERAGKGGFQDTANYYRSLLSNNSEDFNAFAAPEMRKFNEQIVPYLAEQFAGMGSGGLSSSGFRNAAVGAGTDLSERLGAIRAQLRQQGAQGLQGIASQGLVPHSQWQTTQPGSEGLLSQLAPAIGTAAGTAIGGPLGGLAGNWLASSMKGSTGPYQSMQNQSNAIQQASNPQSQIRR